jgi:sialic acid synthase SpsE
MTKVKIGKRWVGEGEPCYIIAEVGSNFDGTIEGAKRMVDLSLAAGADSVKFQSFLPEKIISRKGFANKLSFQSRWEKPVWEVYAAASFPRAWHREIAAYCGEKGIDFSSSPYDREAVDLLVDLDVPYIKIGSGEITNLDFLRYAAQTMKPLILGTGASTMAEVAEAVDAILSTGNQQLIILQCITDYPSSIEYANIRAMVNMGRVFERPFGYSDHTPGSLIPVASVALGACVIEKHFTHNKASEGPDHPFAMDPDEMKEMVGAIRGLEKALGSSQKLVTEEERETVIIQRRSLFTTRAIAQGTRLTEEMLEPLRPAVGILPKFHSLVVGMTVQQSLEEGEPLTWKSLGCSGPAALSGKAE